MALGIETIESDPDAAQPQSTAACDAPDRRLHRRVPLTLLGRFMRANKQEYPCRLIDISVGGAAMMSPVSVEAGEAIVVYFDQFPGLEGNVTRQFPGGFAIALNATPHRREKLAAQIAWLVNRHEHGGGEARAHARVIPRNPSSALMLDDGAELPCQVLDVSLSGASIATDVRPPLGSEVRLGKLRSRVVRHHDQGIAVRFLDIQRPTALRRSFG
jgi:hypothetical protein